MEESVHALSVGESFSFQLRRLRHERQLTQEELAQLAGLSVRAVRNVESGRVRSPRKESIDRLADALELTIDERRQLSDAARAERILPGVSAAPQSAPENQGHDEVDIIFYVRRVIDGGFEALEVMASTDGGVTARKFWFPLKPPWWSRTT
jgi:transcriptional regulator with XRE-family HTH domain